MVALAPAFPILRLNLPVPIKQPLTDWGEDAHADTDRTASRVSSKQQKSQRASRASDYLDAAALPQKTGELATNTLGPHACPRSSQAKPGRTGTARSRGAPLAPVGASRQRAAIAKYGMDCHARAWHRGTRGALLKGKTK